VVGVGQWLRRPWRALAYLSTGVLVAALVLLVYLPAALIIGLVAGAPLAALPVAALERRRLGLLGYTVPSPHLPPPRPGLTSWLRTRYGEAATWRAFAYMILLALAMGFIDLFAVGAVVASGYAAFVWPFFGGNWAATTGFVPLLILALIVATAVAWAHAALARGLLGGQTERKVLDLSRSRVRLLDAFDSERRPSNAICTTARNSV
jgi:Putative sensor